MRSKKTLAKRAGGWTFAVERQSEFPQRFPQAGKRRDGPLGIPPSQPKSRTNGIPSGPSRLFPACGKRCGNSDWRSTANVHPPARLAKVFFDFIAYLID